MKHDVTVSAAECAECKLQRVLGRKYVPPAEHLQAQKDAAYAAMKAALGPEPIKVLIAVNKNTPRGTTEFWVERIAWELRAQMEAKR